MKLIQQSKLFFKEGNSDKVYEIDLCELSPDEYLVNFRYGKRGSTLKEGTKTPAAVRRNEAELLFAGLENEKRKKGYQTETEVFMELPSLEAVEPKSAKGAILQRLQDAIEGKNSFKTEWKTSRVIWKAGQMQIEEAIPFIIKLATKGDELQAYSALYTLMQFKATQAIPLFNALAINIRQKQYIRNLAWEALLTVTEGEETAKIITQLLEQLPDDVRKSLEAGDQELLASCLTRYTQEKQVDFFPALYLLGKIYNWLPPLLANQIKTWPFRPPYFRQIRAMYKLAQMRNDGVIVGILSYRFEKEHHMFKRTGTLEHSRKYVAEAGKSVPVGKELKSNESRLAFSQYTKDYFKRNTVKFLRSTAEHTDAATYLKLAVSILLQYSEKDYRPKREELERYYGKLDEPTKKYIYTWLIYPECADSLLLCNILLGNDKGLTLQPGMRYSLGTRQEAGTRNYYYYSDNIKEPYVSAAETTTPTADNQPPGSGSIIGAAVGALKNIFGKKTTDSNQKPLESVPSAVKEATVQRPELRPEYWDAMPEAYVQLLMQAKMGMIQKFAYGNLKAHARFGEIVGRFDTNAVLQLLNTAFEVSQQFGCEVLSTREAEFSRQPEFMARVLNSNSKQAHIWVQERVAKDTPFYLNDLMFMILVIFNSRSENNSWISALLQKTSFTEERQQAILGKVVTELLHLGDTKENNYLAKDAIARLDIIAAQQLQRISWNIVEQLLTSPLEANKILAGKILVGRSRFASPAEIPLSLTELFLQNAVPEIRSNGILLLNQYPDKLLAENIGFILAQTESSYPDVAEAALGCIRKLPDTDIDAGNISVRYLVYVLIRKESFEGAHTMISNFVTEVLKPYWNTALLPKDITKLVHAPYRTGQLAGYDILKAYDKPGDFSVGQIISFGGHEILAVRQWCWNYFKQNVSRIRYERDKALGLLDSGWDDTRAYAFHFFKTEFTEADWDTDTLVSITDSIRPDVENFGKELIARYLKPEHATEYLAKLSEHPSVNVQAFVTAYLSLYAAGKPAMLQQLEFYFRSVLTRVNKARVAKDRIFRFLHEEAIKSEAAAAWVVPVIDDVSAQATVQDKETCIHILTEIKNRYPHLDMHLVVKN
ncbi:hypothetical protein ACTHGU_16180 [Chitinophagaceae bacterium MMS25-I14]